MSDPGGSRRVPGGLRAGGRGPLAQGAHRGGARRLAGGAGFEPAEIEAAVGLLVETGGLDDERFARRFAEDKRELRGWGPERIREALGRAGSTAT